MARVLLVDDDENFTDATKDLLELLGHRPTVADSVSSARDALDKSPFELLMLDLMLPDGSGLQLLDEIDENPGRRVAIITGHPGVKSTIQSLGGPSLSYLTKPIDSQELKKLLDTVDDGAGEVDEDSEERKRVVEDIEKHFGVLIGESPEMQEVYTQIERVAPLDVTVLIQGESGAGKEMVAEAIHKVSGRTGPFVPVNCGAFSKELIGSELFGHEKGAFTGATRRHEGFFERAQNGTLFLDEITEMPLDMQPNLLRVLETGKITRVGGTSEIPVNCRLLAASNRDPQEAIEQGHLREDLFFRLAVFPIVLPPLAERKGDVALLAQFFLDRLNEQYSSCYSFGDGELEKLQQHDWPGNVRELKHIVQRAFILADRDTGQIHFPEVLMSPFGTNTAAAGVKVGASISDMEKQLILSTLKHYDGDKKAAAETLGITQKTLNSRLKEYA